MALWPTYPAFGGTPGKSAHSSMIGGHPASRMLPYVNEVNGPCEPNVVAERATTTTCLAPPVALANSPVPPVTVSVFLARYRVDEDVVASTHTVPLTEVINWLPSEEVVVTEPVSELLAPELHGGGGLAAICDPLVVPR